MPPRGLSTDETVNVVRRRGLAQEPVRVLRIRYRDVNEVAWVSSDSSQLPPPITSVTSGYGKENG